MLGRAHGKVGIKGEMEGGRVCIERVGGLSVLAFMLINTFPTSQYLTQRGGGKISSVEKEKKNWLMKGKGKREREVTPQTKESEGGKKEKRGNERQRKGQRAFDVELVWIW